MNYQTVIADLNQKYSTTSVRDEQCFIVVYIKTC